MISLGIFVVENEIIASKFINTHFSPELYKRPQKLGQQPLPLHIVIKNKAYVQGNVFNEK